MLNVCTLAGRLVRNPELRQTNNGKPVTSFTLAVDRDRKNANGEKETDFVDIVAFNGTAEFICNYFTKGRLAVVSGRLQMRKWQDKDGNNRVSAEIIADNVYFGDSKKDAAEGGIAQNEPSNFAVTSEPDDDLPWF